MSLLIYQVSEIGCMMVADTLSILREEKSGGAIPVCFTAKVQVIAHKDAMTGGTGMNSVLEGWFRHASFMSMASDVDDLADEAATILPEIARRLCPEEEDCRTEVILIGYSTAGGCFRGFSFPSNEGFRQMPMQTDGVYFHPNYTRPGETAVVIDSFDKVLEVTRLIKSRESELMEDREFRVGGPLVLHWMNKADDGLICTLSKKIGQFPDTAADAANILEVGLGSPDVCASLDRTDRLLGLPSYRLARKATLARIEKHNGEAA